ncbi:MAG: response regulator transcription factor [Planctomycetes bacterium]|nr:response regulator transcription factor [Planctomycetota bacterium]MCB9889241.1 response regulator transcription factor [Planctomycetota bacterium]
MTAPQKQQILVIEDEPSLREGLHHNLELDGYAVTTASTGPAGLRHALEGNFSLVLLDLMLPDLDGLEILRQIRDAGQRTPVIIVSAKGRDHEKVAGLELGADDYVTKPFGLAELSARIRAVLRRTAQKSGPGRREVYRFPKLTVDFKRFTVSRDGVEHQLSRYEAEILRMLIDHRGQVVTRGDLLSQVWGYVHLPTTRTVDNHIARLRKKVEATPDEPEHVVTVHGIGYRFDAEEIEA